MNLYERLLMLIALMFVWGSLLGAQAELCVKDIATIPFDKAPAPSNPDNRYLAEFGWSADSSTLAIVMGRIPQMNVHVFDCASKSDRIICEVEMPYKILHNIVWHPSKDEFLTCLSSPCAGDSRSACLLRLRKEQGEWKQSQKEICRGPYLGMAYAPQEEGACYLIQTAGGLVKASFQQEEKAQVIIEDFYADDDLFELRSIVAVPKTNGLVFGASRYVDPFFLYFGGGWEYAYYFLPVSQETTGVDKCVYVPFIDTAAAPNFISLAPAATQGATVVMVIDENEQRTRSKVAFFHVSGNSATLHRTYSLENLLPDKEIVGGLEAYDDNIIFLYTYTKENERRTIWRINFTERHIEPVYKLNRRTSMALAPNGRFLAVLTKEGIRVLEIDA